MQFRQARCDVTPELGLGKRARAATCVDLACKDVRRAIPISRFDGERLAPKIPIGPHAHGLRLHYICPSLTWHGSLTNSPPFGKAYNAADKILEC